MVQIGLLANRPNNKNYFVTILGGECLREENVFDERMPLPLLCFVEIQWLHVHRISMDLSMDIHVKNPWIWIWIWMGNFISTASLDGQTDEDIKFPSETLCRPTSVSY